MTKMIRVTEVSKKSLDWLIDQYSFTTYNDCITTIAVFFQNNNVNPRDSISNNFSISLSEAKYEIKTDIVDLKKFIKEDSQSIRKRHGAIERDYFIAMNRKIDSIYKKLIDDSIEERNEILEKKIINKEDDAIDYSDALKKNNELLESRNKTINELQTIVDKQDRTMNEYFQTLKKLNDSIKYEKTLTGNKIFINLSLEEVNDLFKLIP